MKLTSWELNENKAYYWFIKNYDDKAIKNGGKNSTCSDIYSPKFKCFIEVKKLPSHCGQFTINTGKSKLCKEIINGNLNENTAKLYVKQHYKNKQVKYFIIKIKNKFELLSYNDFFNKCNFNWKIINAKSGTKSFPKENRELLDKIFKKNYYKYNDKFYVKDENIIGSYFYNNLIYIGKNKEIRYCSQTYTKTWQVMCELKND